MVILMCMLGILVVVVVGLVVFDVVMGIQVIIDGIGGCLVLDLDVVSIVSVWVWLQEDVSCVQCEQVECGLFVCICDGYMVEIVVNVNLFVQVVEVIMFGVEGVGLMCIEFLFFECDYMLDEDM